MNRTVENKIIAQLYPHGGPDECRRMLPHLTITCIRSRATRMGLSVEIDPPILIKHTPQSERVGRADIPAIRSIFDLGATL